MVTKLNNSETALLKLMPSDFENKTMVELSNKSGFHHLTVLRSINLLEQKKLIKVVRPSNKRIGNSYKLMAKGKSLVNKL